MTEKVNKLAKRILVGTLVGALSCGGVYGGLIVYRNTNAADVSVYSISDILTNSYISNDSENTVYGTVSSDRMQSVFLSQTQKVREVRVATGDHVKKGDVLMTFDTTLSQIQIEKAENDLAQQMLSLKRMSADLARLRTLSPSSGEGSGDGGAGEGGDESEPTESEREESYTPETVTPHLMSGSGTMDDPYVYLWGSNDVLSNHMLLRLMAGAQEVNDAAAASQGVTTLPGNTAENGNVPQDNPENGNTAGSADSNGQTDAAGDGQSILNEGYTDDDTVDAEAADNGEVTDGDANTVSTPQPEAGTADSGTLSSFIIHAQIPRFSEAYPDDDAGTGVVDNGTGETDHNQAGPDEVQTADGGESTAQDPETAGRESTASGTSSTGVSLDTLPAGCYVTLEVHKDDAVEAPLITSYHLHLYRSGADVSAQLYNPEAAASESETAQASEAEAPAEDGGGGYDAGGDAGGGDEGAASPVSPLLTNSGSDSTVQIYQSDIDWTASYTARELQEMIAQKTKDVRDLTITVKKAQISLKEMKSEISDGNVRAKFDGVVKTVRDADEAQQDNTAVIVLSGGGGYYVTVPVSELDLDQMKEGLQVTVQNSDQTAEYGGTVKTVSEYPVSSTDAFSSGNPFVSYYPAKIQLESDAEMQDNDYVMVTMSSSGEALTGIYLDKMFVRSEDGQRYVYLRDSEGRLKKQSVVTGKTVMGTFLQIKSGLSTKDWIAFPYGADVKEGAKTSEAGYADLYSS